MPELVEVNSLGIEFELKQAELRIKSLEEENLKLKVALNEMRASLKPVTIIKSTEQLICEMEIEKLMITSQLRALTLEETKRLDLLVKNLHVAKEAQKDFKTDYSKLPQGISQDFLAQVASLPDPDADQA